MGCFLLFSHCADAMGEQGAPAGRRKSGEMTVMPLGAHLEELRARLIKCLLALAGTFLLCWVFRERLVAILIKPHVIAMRAFELDTTLKFRSYLEPVVAQLKACIVVALVITAPIIIYQTWAFVAPGLFPHERSKTLKLGAACVVCFGAGVCFGYFLFVPIALRYLLSLSGAATEPVLMIGSYLSMFFLLTFALGIAFQTPVVVFYLVRWGVLDVKSLQKSRKGVILAAFVIGAFLTPPDPLTQIMMAVTLIVLYDLGGLLAAPSAATVKGFLKFAGSVAAIAAGLAAWYAFWPVAEASVIKGTVTVGGDPVEAGRPAKVRRGAVCRTAGDSVARIVFGRKGATEAFLAEQGRLQVNGPRSVRLLGGEALVASVRESAELSVHTAAATVVVAGARAQLACPRPGTLTVTVFRGQVGVKSEGLSRRIAAGETATFHTGGEPVDYSEAEQRWRELTRPE